MRVVAATNKSLPQLVEQGTFRDDLFYRINVLSIEVPPLRKRGDDILLLVAHFVAKYSDELGRAQLRFSDSALEALIHYSWPGNVRELQNLVQQMVVMKEDDLVDLPDLPSPMKSGFHPRGENRSLAQVEADHIRSVLANVNGNKARAARILGIDRKTLYGKIARYGIDTA